MSRPDPDRLLPAPNLAPKDLIAWGRLNYVAGTPARQVIQIMHIQNAESFVLFVQNDSRTEAGVPSQSQARVIVNARQGEAEARVRLADSGIIAYPVSTPLWFPLPVYGERLTLDLRGLDPATGADANAAVTWGLYAMYTTIRTDWRL